MNSELEESGRSARDSLVYDDIASEEDLSKDSVTTPDAHQTKKESNEYSKAGKTSNSVDGEVGEGIEKDNASCTVDKEPYEAKRKLRKDSHDKELWTPVKSENTGSRVTCSDEEKIGDKVLQDSPDDHPMKPPRRHPQKKPEFKKKNSAVSGEVEQKSSLIHSPENDPVKPPRRRLPQPLIPGVMPKPDISKKVETEADSASDDLLFASGDNSEKKPREIVCKPVLTSSPNQDEIPSLSVETVDVLDTSRRTLSYLDVSSGGGTTKRVESFYDFLYSQDGSNSVADVTSPILHDADNVGSALSHSEDHLYDAVPAEDSITESFSKKSLSGSTYMYEEVIVNQGIN